MTSYRNSEPRPAIMEGAPPALIVPKLDWDRPPWNRWAFQHIREILPTAERTVRHPWIYPWQFGHLDQPDWEANKTAFNLNADPLPPLGSRESLWPELCDARPNIRSAIHPSTFAEARQFLHGLPSPVVLLHARGAASHGRRGGRAAATRRPGQTVSASPRARRSEIDTGIGVAIDGGRRVGVPMRQQAAAHRPFELEQ